MIHEISKAIIVSDLHIGLPQFRGAMFMDLVASLDSDIALVLNGDTLDKPSQLLSPSDQRVIDFIRDQSFARPVIWLSGNHEEKMSGENAGQIRFERQMRFGDRLLVVHGDDFDNLKPRARRFLVVFSHFHKYLVQLGAPPVHVAEFAKRWLPFLYRVFTRRVRLKAVQFAKRQNVSTITCGHTHHVEDCIQDGIRYINTGSWTESPRCYVLVTEDTIELIRTES